nr:ribonuclease H-like domain, reverse transcriptase, RNA-dependent DNA polymerase [Tanacetum cinerariifolium]
MSSMKELTFFLGLQVKQKDDGIFISQDKYVADILKKFDFTIMKTASTPMEPNKTLIKDAARFTLLFDTSEPQPPSSTTPPEQVLAAVGDEAVYTEDDDRVVKAATTAASLYEEQESGNINKTQPTTTLNEPSPQELVQFHDPPLSEVNTSGSGVDSMEHQDDLIDFVPPTPYDSPFSGGHTLESDEGRPKINELMNICNKLSDKVLALEQFKTTQDLVIKRLKKKVKRLEKKQRARTIGMKLFKIEELNLSDKGSGETRVFDYTTTAEKDFNAIEPVSTTGDAVNAASVIPDVSIAGPSTSAVGPSTIILDVEEEPRRATPPPTVQSQDKEIAQRLFEKEQAQFEREQRTAREKAAEQEANDAALIEQMKDVQTRIDADALLVERHQQEERERFTIDEQARVLVDLIVERKRFFAAQRAKQIRNKPPTKAQLRNKMVTYLKHTGKYTHNQLKSKNFKEIQILYEREHKWINDFVPMEYEEVNDSKQQVESSKKRSRADHDKESVKKQKLEEDDAEKEELRACLDIVLVDDIAINVESLATKYPIDAKIIWEAIKTKFGGNKESKKIQKTILKQQYKNFAASRSEGRCKSKVAEKSITSLEHSNPDHAKQVWRGHFARECMAPRSQRNRNGYNTRKVVLVETPANALVVTDGMGYDWSYQAKERLTDFSLMAFSSLGSSSLDTERKILNKANLEIIAYQVGLESLESRIVVPQKNEDVFEEGIAFLKYDVK